MLEQTAGPGLVCRCPLSVCKKTIIMSEEETKEWNDFVCEGGSKVRECTCKKCKSKIRITLITDTN